MSPSRPGTRDGRTRAGQSSVVFFRDEDFHGGNPKNWGIRFRSNFDPRPDCKLIAIRLNLILIRCRSDFAPMPRTDFDSTRSANRSANRFRPDFDPISIRFDPISIRFRSDSDPIPIRFRSGFRRVPSLISPKPRSRPTSHHPTAAPFPLSLRAKPSKVRGQSLMLRYPTPPSPPQGFRKPSIKNLGQRKQNLLAHSTPSPFPHSVVSLQCQPQAALPPEVRENGRGRFGQC